MSELGQKGNVVYNAEVDRKYVLRRSRPLTVHEELFAMLPHEDGDFSYRCGEPECPCASDAVPATKVVEATPVPKAERSHRDAALNIMAHRVRDRTGCRMNDCHIAVKRTKDVEAAVAWLTDKRRLVPLYRD